MHGARQRDGASGRVSRGNDGARKRRLPPAQLKLVLRVRKVLFLRHFHINESGLPRQAWDKHRKTPTVEHKGVFVQAGVAAACGNWQGRLQGRHQHRRCDATPVKVALNILRQSQLKLLSRSKACSRRHSTCRRWSMTHVEAVLALVCAGGPNHEGKTEANPLLHTLTAVSKLTRRNASFRL